MSYQYVRLGPELTKETDYATVAVVIVLTAIVFILDLVTPIRDRPHSG